MLKLDLGCGNVKTPGFVGLDRIAMPGVDVLADLDQPLPLASDSAELIYASHALEHVSDLLATLKEIYRVAQHGAQLCVVAPYSQQAIDAANPYHRQAFNEHTPRFWTPVAGTPIDPAEYMHPHAGTWGLSRSDNSDPGIDLRCLKLEFFYFPEYRHLPPDEQRAARQKYLNVCDQIVYHLVVVKRSLDEGAVQELAETMDYYDPPWVELRRAQEHQEQLEGDRADLRAALSTAQTRLAEAQAAQQALELKHQQSLDAQQALETKLRRTEAALQARETELQQTRSALTVERAQAERLTARGLALARELDLYRQRRDVRWLDRFAGGDLQGAIAPAFQQLRDDSLLFGETRGFKLQPSPNLEHVDYLSYRLRPPRAGLRGVLLAAVLDGPAPQGHLGVELVSAANEIVAHMILPLSAVPEDRPVSFTFPALARAGDGALWLRVFVRKAVSPVRILEWRRYAWGSLGPAQRRAFCGLIFDGNAA